MATAKRRPWNQMDHDSELLREEIVYATRTELRGPIPEFLANGTNMDTRWTAWSRFLLSKLR